MKIQHLRFFVAVVDCGGVIKAAERLHLSQPTVSAGLKALELELGHPLFERAGGRRLHPTAKALAFHRSAIDILRQCDAARAQFRRAEPKPTKLRVGVLPTISSQNIGALASALALHEPDTRLQLWEGGPIRLGEWLRQGRIDAAWTIVESNGDRARILWRERFVVFVAPTHRFCQNFRANISLSDLDGESIILRGACEMPRGRLWPDSIRMRVAARAERDELALRLVGSGLGIAIAPQSLATPEVVTRQIRDLDTTRSIGLKWRRELAETSVAVLLDSIHQLPSASHHERPPNRQKN